MPKRKRNGDFQGPSGGAEYQSGTGDEYQSGPGAEYQGGASPEMVGDTTVSRPDRDRVAQRAYELYLERGCEDGRADEDWLCAERELTNGGRQRGES